MRALSACAFSAAAVGVLLAVMVVVLRPPCTGATAGSTLHEFRAPTSLPTVLI